MGLTPNATVGATRSASLAIVLSVAFGAGCSDEDDIELPLVFDDFEQGCPDALPCGWARREGGPDRVLRVSTFHAGEHALRLVDDGASAVGAAGAGNVSGGGFGGGPTVVMDVAFFPDPLGAQLVGRCDGEGDGVAISLAATVGAGGPEAPPIDPVAVRYEGNVTIGDRDASVGRGLLSLAEMPDPPPPDGSIVQSTQTVTLTKRGPGTCDVSLLAIGSIPDDLR